MLPSWGCRPDDCLDLVCRRPNCLARRFASGAGAAPEPRDPVSSVVLSCGHRNTAAQVATALDLLIEACWVDIGDAEAEAPPPFAPKF